MHGYPRKPAHVCFGGGGRWLATSGGATPMIWSFEDRGPENTEPLELPVHTLPVTTLAAAGQYSALASGGRDGGVVVWKVDSSDAQIVGFALCEDPIEQLAFRPDDQALAAITRGSQVEVWRCRLSKMRT
jgi:WD40 repeat protein